MNMCEERDALDLMLEERENRIKSPNLEQEEFKKTFREKAMALQQIDECHMVHTSMCCEPVYKKHTSYCWLQHSVRLKLVCWRAKLERVMKERSEHEQRVKKEIQALLLKLFKTERLHQTQICDYEVKYRDSLKLVPELQRQIEEREVAVLQNKQEKLAKAASNVLEPKRRMAMSREKYLEHHMKKAS
ncbi:uncharacterized protein LOC135246899 isoform X2 [Anguilla rostrata]